MTQSPAETRSRSITEISLRAPPTSTVADAPCTFTTLAGTPRHIVLSSRDHLRGVVGLPQRDPPVVRRNLPVDQDLEPFPPESGEEPLHQVKILEDAPRQQHVTGPGPLRKRLRNVEDDLRHRVVELPREDRGGDPRLDVGDEPGDHAFPVYPKPFPGVA